MGKGFWVGRRTFGVHGGRDEDRDDGGDPYPTTGERSLDVGMATVLEPYLEVEVTFSQRVAAAAGPVGRPTGQGNTMHNLPYSVEKLDCSTDAVVARRWKAAHGRYLMVSARG